MKRRFPTVVRWKREKRRRQYLNDATWCRVLENLWGFGSGQVQLLGLRLDAYLDHFNNLTYFASTLRLYKNREKTLELLKTVQDNHTESISDILEAIKQVSSGWRGSSPWNDEEASQALHLVTRLWLFSEPKIEQVSQTLETVNRELYSIANSRMTGVLSSDFSARSLTRKGGFYLVWTSDLSKHLTFASKDQLWVFRHAYVLLQYNRGAENNLYPSGFLLETYQTINLLFPVEDFSTSKRVRYISKHEEVDLEAARTEKAMADHESLQISSYPYYGSRLVEIQRRYDLARPHRLTQWWYDRRQRPEWAALVIALVVFILTVLFGVAQTVTGVLQVTTAHH